MRTCITIYLFIKFKISKMKKNLKKETSTKKSNGNSVKSEIPTVEKKQRWRNKQRVLLLSSRGVSYLARHLLDNLKTMLPHSRTDSKFNRKKGLSELNEIAEIRNCSKCIYLEMHKKQDAFVWLSAQPHGPSVKFLVENVHTMEELKLTGNCLKGSRPLLAFGDEFDAQPEFKVVKELLVQIFGTPNFHPKSQPFVDHVINFSLLDNKIWVRNYQIGDEMAEIGPRYDYNSILKYFFYFFYTKILTQLHFKILLLSI